MKLIPEGKGKPEAILILHVKLEISKIRKIRIHDIILLVLLRMFNF